LNWRLTLIVLLAAPVLIIASQRLGRSVRKYSLAWQEVLERLGGVLKESLGGIKVVKAFNLERHLQHRFQTTSNRVLDLLRKIFTREEVNGPLFELLAAVIFAAILYYAGNQIIHGNSTPGVFMSFVFVLGSLQGPVKKLQDAHVRMQHAVAATDRVF